MALELLFCENIVQPRFVFGIAERSMIYRFDSIDRLDCLID